MHAHWHSVFPGAQAENVTVVAHADLMLRIKKNRIPFPVTLNTLLSAWKPGDTGERDPVFLATHGTFIL